MPNRGPVYQPTTESYGHQGEWRSPSGLLSQTTTSVGRDRCLQWVTLGLGILAIVSGVILIIAGGATFANAESENLTPAIILVIGLILAIIGIVLLTITRYGSCRPNCFRLLMKEKRIALQMRDSQSVNGQAMNPSTDFLVSAQYAPVSEIAYQPPAVSEEEETRKLMGSDNKDCLLKETDSIITLNLERFEPGGSPELRRLNYNMDTAKAADKGGSALSNKSKSPAGPGGTSGVFGPGIGAGARSTWKDTIMRKASVRSKRAPLAGFEDITPSLRSSWSSMYFNQTPTDSGSDVLSYISDTL